MLKTCNGVLNECKDVSRVQVTVVFKTIMQVETMYLPNTVKL